MARVLSHVLLAGSRDRSRSQPQMIKAVDSWRGVRLPFQAPGFCVFSSSAGGVSLLLRFLEGDGFTPKKGSLSVCVAGVC